MSASISEKFTHHHLTSVDNVAIVKKIPEHVTSYLGRMVVTNPKAFKCFEGLKIGRKQPRSRHSSKPLQKEGKEARRPPRNEDASDGFLVPGGEDFDPLA